MISLPAAFTFHLDSLSYMSAYGKSVSLASLVGLTVRAIKELVEVDVVV